MPTYVYQCKKCGEVFEVHASFKEKEKGLTPECPACHEKTCRQMLTTGSLLIHNTGGGGCAGKTCGPNCRGNCCGG
ncbi:MAG: FmdB family zinc ribbon protein [Bacteroidota bacterium]